MEHGTFFNDPAQVQQWVVTSATGSALPLDYTTALSGNRHGGQVYNDATSTGPFLSGSTYDSHFSLSDDTGLSEFPGTGALLNGTSGVASGMAVSAVHPLDIDFNDDDASASAYLPCDPWTCVDTGSYAVPGSTEMMYTTSADSHRYEEAEQLVNSQFHSSWPEARYPGTDLLSNDYDACALDQSVWCPPGSTTMNPSISSSSFSQGSYFPQLAGSPTSFSTQEDLHSLDPNEDYGFSPTNLDGPTSVPHTSGLYDEQWDPARFV